MVTPQNNKIIPQAVYKNRYLLFYLSVSTCAMIGLFHCPVRSIQKFVLMAKMSQDENFETHSKEKYANEQKKQTSEADIPDFQVGFFEILEEDKRRMEENEHDEDNSTRELDDFIAAERSSSTQKKISEQNARGKCLKGFANRR